MEIKTIINGNRLYNWFDYFKNLTIRNTRIAAPAADINPELLDNALEKGASWLKKVQREDGSIGARHFEIWETIAAAKFLLNFCPDSDSLEKAYNFIMEGRRTDGGFFYERLPPKSRPDLALDDVYCCETTPFAVMFLYAYKGKKTEEVDAGIRFIFEKQAESGQWGCHYIKNQFFPSVTGFNLWCLGEVDVLPDDAVNKAITFLERTQRKNGSWGTHFSYYGTEAYPIYSISNALFSLSLKNNLSNEIKTKIEKMLPPCKLFIQSRQNIDGSWSLLGNSSKSLCTALYLQSPLAEDGFLNLGVNWLLKMQRKDGCWNGGTLSGADIPVYATSHALLALYKYKVSIDNYEK